jgi:hypothetical protein
MSKPAGPGVIRTNVVLVWHARQSGRIMIMMLRLGQAGTLQNSQSPVDTEGGGDGGSIELQKPRRCSVLLTFQ